MAKTDFDDDIDFKALKKELDCAVEKNKTYYLRNDAKFRAVAQKVATYDEFRNIVDASHLTPLDKDDKIGGIIRQKWNYYCSDKDKGLATTNTSPTVTSPKLNFAPIAYQEFLENWKHLCKTPMEKFNYLVGIESDLLTKCLKLECPVGEVLSSLAFANKESDEEHNEAIISLLKIIQNTKRFKLQLAFLEPDEEMEMKDLFKNLTEWAETEYDNQIVKDLQKSYLNY